MVRLFCVLVCAGIMLSFSGCPNFDVDFTGFMAAVGQSMATMASDTDSLAGQSQQTIGMSAMGVAGAADPVPDENGWVIVSRSYATTTVTAQYRFLKEDSSVITAATLLELYALAEAQAKTMEFTETASSSRGQFDCDLTFTRTTVGQHGGFINGAASGSNSQGGSFTATFTNIGANADTEKKILGGTITASFTTAKGKTWTISFTFDNVTGTADGTITGPSRSATFHLNADGSGYYSDSDGQHDLEAPASVS